MKAITLITTLTFTNATGDKLETATNVLAELHKMKGVKGMPFMAIRKAIKMQEKTIKDLK